MKAVQKAADTSISGHLVFCDEDIMNPGKLECEDAQQCNIIYIINPRNRSLDDIFYYFGGIESSKCYINPSNENDNRRK